MTYYAVDKPSTSFYTVTVAAKTWYTSSIFGLRTWKSLNDINVRMWAKLKELNLMTWKRLGASRGLVSLFYLVSNPSTSFHNVADPTTTYYEVT